MSEEAGTRTIEGHQIELSGGRLVWAGEYDDSWYIRFNDGAGNERGLRLSYEATNALMSLVAGKARREATQEIYRYVISVADTIDQMKWEVVHPQSPQGSEEANG